MRDCSGEVDGKPFSFAVKATVGAAYAVYGLKTFQNIRVDRFKRF